MSTLPIRPVAVAVLVAVIAASTASAQTPVEVTNYDPCELDLPHTLIEDLRKHFLAGNWIAVEAELARVRAATRSCTPTLVSAKAMMVSWMGAGPDGKNRIMSAMHPSLRSFEHIVLDPREGSTEHVYQVFLSDRENVTVAARFTSERKDNPLPVSATAFVGAAVTPLLTGLSTANLAFSRSITPLTTPADPSVRPPPPSPDPRPVVVATIQRLNVPHKSSTVKGARKYTIPLLPQQVLEKYREAAKPIRARWTGRTAVLDYLTEVEKQVMPNAATCANQAAADCQIVLLTALALAFPPSRLATDDLRDADKEVRAALAGLASTVVEDEVSIRNEGTTRLGFTTLVGYSLWRNGTAEARIKAGADATKDSTDPMPGLLTGFGVTIAGAPYAKTINELTVAQRLRFGAGLVATPNLGGFASAGVVVLPRLSVVVGVSALAVPTALTEDRRKYLKELGVTVFVGSMIEFP